MVLNADQHAQDVERIRRISDDRDLYARLYRAARDHNVFLEREIVRLNRVVSELTVAAPPRDIDSQTGIDPFAGRCYTWAESKEIPPPGYQFIFMDDDPGHPASQGHWLLVETVS